MQSSTFVAEEVSSPMPLTDLPTNVPFQSTSLQNTVLSSPTNKENFVFPKTIGTSSIPVRTPSKDLKCGISLTPKLRRGHLFSKSSSDLLTSSQRSQQVSKPGYMAATAASKFRETGPDSVFVEPAAPSSGTSTRFISSNPFK